MRTGKKLHNHGSSDYSGLNELMNDLKRAARENSTNRSLRDIFNEVTREHPLGASVAFP